MKKLLSFLGISIILMASCKKDEPSAAAPNKKKIAEATTAGGLKIDLWSDNSSFTVAYNKVYLSVRGTDGNDVANAIVKYHPLMKMASMQHSCPVEQPSYNSGEHLYEGAVVFSMASGDMEAWQLGVEVNGELTVFNVEVASAATGIKHTGTFAGIDGNSYSVSLVEPSKPKTGVNDLDILVNRRQDMMTFPPEKGFTVELTPEMPSMMHGSPNNINPVDSGEGHYKGKVNFTMTGDWRLHLRLKRGDAVIVEDAALDLLF